MNNQNNQIHTEAFPNPANPMDDVYSRGMFLLDYFAAKAPSEIPDWYNPIDSDLVKDEENSNFKVYRYFQWRWYYAQQMLRERENWLK